MSDWFRVPALAGPLEDIHRVVPKPLLHCLGCVCRVIVMLEGELSAQSEFLSALNQVFIKDISVLICIQLSVFSDHFPLPLKNTPTACVLHSWDGIMQVISGTWFPSDMNKELRFIIPENLLFFIVWELFGCIFVNSNQGFMYLYWGEAWVWSLCYQALIGGVSQWYLSFCKFLLSPYKIIELNQSDHQCLDHLSNQDPSPSIAQFGQEARSRVLIVSNFIH